MILLRLLFCASFLTLGNSFSQQPSSKKLEDRIKLSIANVGHSSDGRLVLGVRIAAKLSEDLTLQGEREKAGVDQVAGEMPFQAFTLAGSYLVDSYSNQKIEASPNLPRRPYYGPMEIVMKISKGGWLDLGIAFPKPPPPPLNKDGKPQPYRLMLHTPLDAEPALVTFSTES